MSLALSTKVVLQARRGGVSAPPAPTYYYLTWRDQRLTWQSQSLTWK